MSEPSPPRARLGREPLFRKYVAIIVLLVGGALSISGLLQLYFAYQENQAALLSLQGEKAAGASGRIREFLLEIERQIGGAVDPGQPGSTVPIEQRRNDYLRLLRQAPAITEISYLDPSGHEQLRISRVAVNVVGGAADLSQDPRFLRPRTGLSYFSSVYFRNDSEPYLSVGIAERGGAAGVSVAEVNLKFIWDVVAQISVGRAGYAYLVDGSGRLIAYPDVSLVLQQTDVSSLPQVMAARTGGETGAVATDLQGHPVLTAHATVDPPGWTAFVEQPLSEAFAPLYASLLRTVLLILVGVILSVIASLVLARRMVRPIEALQAGAAQIGAGALDHRIEVHTGDEIEDLAAAFNRMAGQVRDSYATLEQRVEVRTRDLAEALAHLRALGEVSQAVNSSLDLQQVLTTIVTRAVQLSGTDAGSIYEFDEIGQQLHLRATHGMSDELIQSMRQTRLRLGETVVGQAAVLRSPVQSPDIGDKAESGPYRVLYQAGFRALLAVPLLREDRVIGALVVRRRAAGEFPAEAMDLLQTFAAQSVLAVQNARLFQEIERKSRQLEVASRHKSEFLANMSHELRTPLNAIIGFSEVLIENLFGELNAKQSEYLEDILGAGRHLLSLINDILDLSKVEAGRMDLDVGSFSLAEALENGLAMVRERAMRHGVTLSLDVDPGIGMIEADERRVKQVMFNLLSNAVKFTPERGQVEVVARLSEAEITVEVRDTGIGIAVADQARIFDEFQQVNGSSERAQEGTGLGLTLARKFVELHGGTLWVESEVGRGSTFRFTLPVRAAPSKGQAEPSAAPITEPRRRAVASPTVLVVEDNAQAVELLRLYLEGDGLHVVVASDGEAGLALARDLQPAAIVLDILLPGVDGWEFLARAKADPAIGVIPIVIVSLLDERGRGFALGAADYLVKPVARDTLLATLRRLRLTPDGHGRPRVLAIDDDPIALELIEAVLSPEGYSVSKATSGEDGLSIAARERPGLIIVDLLMPQVDGFAIVERLRADERTAGVPIVILTSQTMTDQQRVRLNGQISHLAQKGDFSRAAFVDLVRRLCPVPVG